MQPSMFVLAVSVHLYPEIWKYLGLIMKPNWASVTFAPLVCCMLPTILVSLICILVYVRSFMPEIWAPFIMEICFQTPVSYMNYDPLLIENVYALTDTHRKCLLERDGSIGKIRPSLINFTLRFLPFSFIFVVNS